MVSKWSTLKEIQKNTSDWKVVKLNDFSTKAKNSFVNGPFGSDLLSSELTNEGRPVVYIRDIQNGSYKNKSNICITEEKFESLPSCQVGFGDVIISKVGTPPCEAAIYDSQISGIVTQDVIRIRCEKLPQSIFLKYLLNSDIGKRQVQQIKISGTRERVSLTDFKKIRLPQPTINEQQKIAKTLSTWDKAISTTERLIDNSTQQKKALMQQLLTGKKRLAGFNEEWISEPLEKVVGKIYGGGTPSKNVPEYWDGDIPWVTVKDLIATKIDGAQQYINKSGLENSSANMVPAGTVIIATRMALGKAVIASCDVAINQDLKAITGSPKIDSMFLHYWLLLQAKAIEKLGTGSTVKGVQLETIKSLRMHIPSSIQEQQKIATVLTNADKEIELLEQQLADLQQEKKALMQVLLTGKKRVRVDGEVL